MTPRDGVAVSFFYCDYRQRFVLFSCCHLHLWAFLQEFFPAISRLWDGFVSIDEANLCAG